MKMSKPCSNTHRTENTSCSVIHKRTKNKTLNRFGFLPPHVKGKIIGYLDMKIDHIKWRNASQRGVHVYVSWWGEEQSTLFILQGTSFTDQSLAVSGTSCVYRIMTSTELFVNYLHDCEELNFYVYDQEKECHVGTASLKHLESIILCDPFRTLCPVIDKNGYEVADLMISFAYCCNTSEQVTCLIKEEDLLHRESNSPVKKNKNITLNKDKHSFISEIVGVKGTMSGDFQPNNMEIPRMTTSESRNIKLNINDDIVSNSTISELLEESYGIRQEYFTDGLADLRNENIDKTLASSEHIIRDFLLGKDLTAAEECFALDALKFNSPVSDLLRLVDTSNLEDNAKTDNSVHFMKNQSISNVWSQEFSPEKTNNNFEIFEKQAKDTQNKEMKSEVMLQHLSASLHHSKKEGSLPLNYKFLRLTIQILSLNFVGIQRVRVSSRALSSSMQNTHMKPLPSSIVYFVEYEIPQCLRPCSSEKQEIKKPWNCNLHRICSRQKEGKCIHFHRQMIHKLASCKPKFKELLSTSFIIFKVYTRHLNQRLPCLLGEASLSFGNVVKSSVYNSLQEIPIYPQTQDNCSHMLSLGILKLKVEFGASLSSFQSKCMPPVLTQVLVSSSEKEYEVEGKGKHTPEIRKKNSKLINKQKKVCCRSYVHCAEIITKKNNPSESFMENNFESDCKFVKTPYDKNGILLFGLLHVSRGRGIESSSTYLVSHGFWKEDVMTSEIHYHTKNPAFKFHKIMPVLLSLELMDRCYNNFMIIEVWSQSSIIGIAKLPLKQFYIAFRDPQVVEQLLLSRYPIISVDGWVDIVNPISQQQFGQLNVVLALGTENQVQMLEMSRCLKEDIDSQVVSKSFPVKINSVISRSTSPVNESEKIEEVFKLNPARNFQNEINLHVDERNCTEESNGMHFSQNGVPKELLFASSDHLNDSHQTYIHQNASDLHVHEECTMGSYENSKVLDPKNNLLDFKGSFVSDMRDKKFTGISVMQESLYLGHDVPSDLKMFTKSDVIEEMCDRGNENSSFHNHIISGLHKEFLEKCHANENVSLRREENLPHVSKSINNSFDDKDSCILSRESMFQNEVGVNCVVNFENPEFECVHESYCEHPSLHDSHCGCEQKSMFSNKSATSEVLNSSRKSKDENADYLICNTRPKVQDGTQSHSSGLTLSDLDGSTEAIAHSVLQNSSELSDSQPFKSVDYSSNVGSTHNASNETDILHSEHFFALIEVISALYISKVESDMLPNCYVTFHSADNSVMSTPVINENTDPVWNWSCKVWLPILLLKNNAASLDFKVLHKKTNMECPISLEDFVIGFVSINLRALAFGLPTISGWFNICDTSGNCKGQIQIGITPLENLMKIPDISQSKSNVERKYLEESPVMVTHPDTERCQDMVYYGREILQYIPFSGPLGKKHKYLPLQNRDRYSASSKSESHSSCKTKTKLDEPPEVYYGSGRKVVPVLSQMNEISFNQGSKRISEDNLKKDESSEQSTFDVNFSNIFLSRASGNRSAHSCKDHDQHSSALKEILLQKLQEMDTTILQMNNVSNYSKDEKNKKETSENNFINVVQVDEDHCCKPVTSCSKLRALDIFPGMKLEDILNLHSEKQIFWDPCDSTTKNNTESDINLKQESETNLDSLCPLNESSNPSNYFKRNFKVNHKSCETAKTRNFDCIKDLDENVISSDSSTDHLMNAALLEVDLENIFNPLLFQHIIANHQSLSCCSQWIEKLKLSRFSLPDNCPTTSQLSEVNEVYLQKSDVNSKKLSGISLESCFEKYDGDNKLEANCITVNSLPGLTEKTVMGQNHICNVFGSENECENECEKCENARLSKNPGMQNIYSKTFKNRTKNCNSCNSNLVELLHYMDDSPHNDDQSVLSKSKFSDESEDPKILNATMQSEKNCIQNSMLSLSSSKILAFNSSQVCLDKESSSGGSVAASPCNKCGLEDQKKVKTAFSNAINLQEYPSVLNEFEMKCLINILKNSRTC